MVDASYYTTIVYTREGSGKAKQQIVLTGTSTAVECSVRTPPWQLCDMNGMMGEV